MRPRKTKKWQPGEGTVPIGRRWKTLNYAQFNRRFPRIGQARMNRRLESGEKISKKKLKKLYRYPNRASPCSREGAKFKNVMLPLDVYLRLKELSKFHKCSMAAVVRNEVNRLFDEAYKQAEVLARIEANREKNEALNASNTRRRYNV